MAILDSSFFSSVGAVVNNKSEGYNTISTKGVGDGIYDLATLGKSLAVPDIWQTVVTDDIAVCACSCWQYGKSECDYAIASCDVGESVFDFTGFSERLFVPNVWQLTILDSGFFAIIGAVVDSKSEGNDTISAKGVGDGIYDLATLGKSLAVPDIWQTVVTDDISISARGCRQYG